MTGIQEYRYWCEVLETMIGAIRKVISADQRRKISYRKSVKIIGKAVEGIMHADDLYELSRLHPMLRWIILKRFYRARYKTTQAKLASKIPNCYQSKVSRVLGDYAQFLKLSPDEYLDWYRAFSTFRSRASN